MLARATLFILIGWLSAGVQAQVWGPVQTSEGTDTSRVFVLADTLTTPLLPNPCTSNGMRCGNRWLGPDKALHLGASFLGTVSMQYVLTSKGGISEGAALPISAATTLSAGLIKELIDANREQDPLFSWKDLTADTVGILLAIGLISL